MKCTDEVDIWIYFTHSVFLHQITLRSLAGNKLEMSRRKY